MNQETLSELFDIQQEEKRNEVDEMSSLRSSFEEQKNETEKIIAEMSASSSMSSLVGSEKKL